MGKPAGVVRALALALAIALAGTTTVQAQDEAQAQTQSFWGVGSGTQAQEAAAPPEENAQAKVPPREETRLIKPKRERHDARPDGPRVWYIGPWFRYLIVPSFVLNLFLDASPTVASPAFGLNATMRGKTVSWVLGLGYTSYNFEDPFLAKGDPVLDTEWVDSSLGLLHATTSILWHSKLDRAFTFEYGFGADLGIVWGDLRRSEAYPYPSGKWAPCMGPGNPDLSYCEPGPVPYDERGAHYDVEEKRIPPVAILPMLPHLALRMKPAKHWAAKLEAAYGILQLWVGLSVAYAPKL